MRKVRQHPSGNPLSFRDQTGFELSRSLLYSCSAGMQVAGKCLKHKHCPNRAKGGHQAQEALGKSKRTLLILSWQKPDSCHQETPDGGDAPFIGKTRNSCTDKKLLSTEVDSEGYPQGESYGRVKVKRLSGGAYKDTVQANARIDAGIDKKSRFRMATRHTRLANNLQLIKRILMRYARA